MQYRLLGRTGVRVSELALGTSVLVRSSKEEDRLPIIRRAVEAGINFIDTADVYGQGEAERLVGRAIRDLGRRDSLFIATKAHSNMAKSRPSLNTNTPDPNARGNSRRHLIAACEASLQRLGLDHIDLYQLHRPESHTPIDETLRALDDLVRQGKVRYLGTSTFAAWQLVESLWASDRLGLNRFVSEQPPYHLLDRRPERSVLPMARTYGLAIVTWSPLAAGMLSGKYPRDDPAATPGRLTEGKTHFADKPNFRDRVFDAVDAVVALAREKGCTPSQLALAWVKSQPGVTCPIIGNRTPEQLEENLGCLDVTITVEDRQRLDAAAPPGGVLVPYHSADWGPHPYRM